MKRNHRITRQPVPYQDELELFFVPRYGVPDDYVADHATLGETVSLATHTLQNLFTPYDKDLAHAHGFSLVWLKEAPKLSENYVRIDRVLICGTNANSLTFTNKTNDYAYIPVTPEFARAVAGRFVSGYRYLVFRPHRAVAVKPLCESLVRGFYHSPDLCAA